MISQVEKYISPAQHMSHTQHSPLGANYYLQCRIIWCLNFYRLLNFCIIEVGFLSLFLVCVQVCLVLEEDSSTCPLPLLLPHMSGDIPLGWRGMVMQFAVCCCISWSRSYALCGVWQEWSVRALAFHSQCVCSYWRVGHIQWLEWHGTPVLV